MPVNHDVSARVWERYQLLRDNGHLDFVKKSSVCEDFFMGIQWDKNDLQLLKESRRPALTINKIISTISNVLGEQIFNRTDIAFKPRNEGATAEIADALTKVFMQIGDNNQLSWVRSDVFADGIISSRGFFDVRLDFSDSLRGEVRIEQVNPKNVLIDMDADAYDPDTWGDVIVTKWMSIDQIELVYSKKDADLLRGRTRSYYPYGADSIDLRRDRFGQPMSTHYSIGQSDKEDGNIRDIRVIERQWRKLDMVRHFVDVVSGDTRIVPDDWDEPRVQDYLLRNPTLATTKKLIQRIRWTVVADDVVLHDEWSPYKHFTIVPYFPYFQRGRTIGLVENLIGPQELLNKVSSQELHVVNTTANSGWIVEANNLVNMSIAELEQRGAQTGLALEVRDVGKIEKITPNQVPSGLDRISFKAEDHIKSISGVSDYMQGFAREDVSAKSVNSNKQSGQANLAKVMDNMNRTDSMLARNILDMVQAFYTEERLIRITTDRLTNKTEQMVVNQITPEGQIVNDLTIGEYAVIVTNQPERDTFEETQFAQAIELRTKAGVAIPDKFIIEASRLKNKADIITAMEGDKTSPEAQAQAALAQRAQAAEVGKLEADVSAAQADTALKLAKAKTEANSADSNRDEMAIEMEKLDRESEMEMIKLDRQFALDKKKLEYEMQLKRDMATQEMALKQEQMKQDTMTKRMAVAHQAKNEPKPTGVTP